jgi:HAD superfamily hydrolase (TIGR01509 family)
MGDTPGYPFAAVLFDMDGVIVLNTELHNRVWAEFARRHEARITDAQLAATPGRRALDTVREWFGPDLPAERHSALVDARQQLYEQSLRGESLEPTPGLLGFLEQLSRAGIPRALVTSALPPSVSIILGKLDLIHRFDAVVTAVDVKHGKPHPEPYQTAAARLGVACTRCLIVEDAPVGVDAAVAAGATCLGLSTTVPPRLLTARGARWTVPDFEHLPEEIRPAAR